MKYYIYHIPGVKIGCSLKPRRRVKGQGYTEYEIIEEHTDIDLASQREIELQKQYGYRLDVGNEIYGDKFSKMGSIGGKKTGKKESTIKRLKEMSSYAASCSSKYGLTDKQFEARSKTGRMTGPINILKANKISLEKRKRKTLAYDMNGNFIGEFDSIKSAAISLSCKVQHVSRVVHGKRKSTKGYTFKFKENETR